MVPLERLSVASIVAAAGCVTDVADRERAVDPFHDRLEFVAMIEAKRFGDRAHFLVGLDQRTAVRAKTAHARGELAAVLHVQKHARHQPGHAVDVAGDRRQRRNRGARGMVNSGHAAFVVKLTHRLVPPRKKVAPVRKASRRPDEPGDPESCLPRPVATKHYNVGCIYRQPSQMHSDHVPRDSQPSAELQCITIFHFRNTGRESRHRRAD